MVALARLVGDEERVGAVVLDNVGRPVNVEKVFDAVALDAMRVEDKEAALETDKEELACGVLLEVYAELWVDTEAGVADEMEEVLDATSVEEDSDELELELSDCVDENVVEISSDPYEDELDDRISWLDFDSDVDDTAEDEELSVHSVSDAS